MNNQLEDSLRQLNVYTEKLKKYLEKNDMEDFDFDNVLKDNGIDLKEIESQMSEAGKLPLYYKKLSPDAVVPHYNYKTDSGFDLYSTIELEIPAFGRGLIPTGLAFGIKEGFEIQVRSKSGLALNQGLMCLNSPGTVDSGYNGEVKVIIFNTNNHPVKIIKGMKVAQAVVSSVVNGRWVDLNETRELEKKDRNNNGFGSTGI